MSTVKHELGGTRYLGFVVFVGFAFSLLLGRLWLVQVLDGDQYWRASTENIIRNIEVSPPRGRIFDRSGNVLAENRPSFDVVIQPHLFSEPKNGDVPPLELLQGYLNLSKEDVERLAKKIAQKRGEVVVARDITRSQVALVETDRLRLPGVEVRANSHRRYPLEHVTAHVVGFMGEIRANELKDLEAYGYRSGDYLGRMGVERAYESILRGAPGIERQVVDARGIPQGEAETRFLIGDYQKVTPIAGRDVFMTLDARLQIIVDEAMKNYPAGAVVALDPRDGSLLAMYSKPGFNPNSWSGRLSTQEKLKSDNDPYKPMLDKTISAYFPGSTFKIAGALAALDEGIMDADDEVKCPGYYRFGGRNFRCWKHGGHGDVNVAEALQHSCDVYFYKVAETIGIDKIAEYGFDFGFGELTGYPINDESAGRMPTKEWHRKHSPDGFQHGFALNTILGQGDTLATPLQVALAYGAVANGGKLYYPRIIDHINTATNDALFEFEPRVRKTVPGTPEAFQQIREGLWKTVNEDGGTAFAHRPTTVEVSGKTGTAQVHKIGRIRVANRDKEIRFRDHAWFAGYAPSTDPTLVVVVFLQHGGHGGSDAAPVAMDIFTRYFAGDDPLARKIGEEYHPPSPSNDDALDDVSSGEELVPSDDGPDMGADGGEDE
ncbi:MAG: penicillin-binding protein 2 [bacterium]